MNLYEQAVDAHHYLSALTTIKPKIGLILGSGLGSIVEEMTRSLNAAHCSCCSVALITAVRCIPNVEDSQAVKELYVSVTNDWSCRKATKIHCCVFDDVIKRMPRYVMMSIFNRYVSVCCIR